MIAVTCRNGEHFSVDPDAIERVETDPDTVIHLVDGTKYVVAESFEHLLLTIREVGATVTVAQKRLAGGVAEIADHASDVKRSSVRLERRQYSRYEPGTSPSEPQGRTEDGRRSVLALLVLLVLSVPVPVPVGATVAAVAVLLNHRRRWGWSNRVGHGDDGARGQLTLRAGRGHHPGRNGGGLRRHELYLQPPADQLGLHLLDRPAQQLRRQHAHRLGRRRRGGRRRGRRPGRRRGRSVAVPVSRPISTPTATSAARAPRRSGTGSRRARWAVGSGAPGGGSRRTAVPYGPTVSIGAVLLPSVTPSAAARSAAPSA